MSKLSITQLNRSRLAAKNQARDLGVSLHQAQDSQARKLGYSNWAIMMKHAASDEGSGIPPFRFIRSLEDTKAAMRDLPETFERTPGRDTPPNAALDNIWDKFHTPKHAINFAIDYMTELLKVPRFKISMRSLVYWELRSWLPYVLEPVSEETQVLANRYYKPVGLEVTEHVDYKKFRTLHTKLTPEQISKFSHSPTSQGYLYDESPWSSRKAAEAYLKRLQVLSSLIT